MNYHSEVPPRILAEYDIEFFELSSTIVAITANAHIHSALEILYFTDGNYMVAINGEQIKVSVGDMVIFPSNTVHSIYHLDSSLGRYYVLKLTSNILFEIFKGGESIDCLTPFSRSLNGEKTIFRGAEMSKEIIEIWHKMIDEYDKKSPIMYTMEKAYAFELLIHIYRNYYESISNNEQKDIKISPKMRSLIYESISYINDNYASNITPYECARYVNLSYSYYAKLFHAITGKSFKEYLTGIRLAKAYNALISTDLPITEIAMCCGYKNSAYFAAEFKKYYGKTPGNIQKGL